LVQIAHFCHLAALNRGVPENIFRFLE